MHLKHTYGTPRPAISIQTDKAESNTVKNEQNRPTKRPTTLNPHTDRKTHQNRLERDTERFTKWSLSP